jgi:hypothetical protein
MPLRLEENDPPAAHTDDLVRAAGVRPTMQIPPVATAA